MNETNDGVKYPHRAVLLIEDSRTDARLVATYLNSLPTPPSLTHCLSLADAQDLSTMAFDVILTDLNLPDSGGVATVTAVVAAFPGNPVIALTTDEARGVECIGAGAQDFLPKDEMNSKTLARAIEYAVLRTEQVNRAQYESSHDSLTGVLNRQAFHEGAESQLTHTGPEDGIFLLFADVDNFKEINDGYGHAAGDQVLREVAGRLREAVRTSDLVARWGGDEFTIFGRIHPDDFASLVDRIRGATRFSVSIAGEDDQDAEVPVRLSLGAALSQAGVPQFDELLRTADLNMYDDKNGIRAREAVGSEDN